MSRFLSFFLSLDCSSKSIPLPDLGLNEEVRVCETCHFKIVNKSSIGRDIGADTPGNDTQAALPPLSKEDEELQRAIAASLEISKKPTQNAPKPPVSNHADAGTLLNSYLDLERAIQESLKEAEKAEQERSRSRPKPKVEAHYQAMTHPEPTPTLVPASRPSSDLTETQLTNISLFASLVEGQSRDISQNGYASFNPIPLQTLFAQVSTLHGQLTASVQEAADKYKELYDMNSALHEVIHSYDSLLQQRLQYSQAPKLNASLYGGPVSSGFQAHPYPYGPGNAYSGQSNAPPYNLNVPQNTPAQVYSPSPFGQQPAYPPQFVSSAPPASPGAPASFQPGQQHPALTSTSGVVPQYAPPQQPPYAMPGQPAVYPVVNGFAPHSGSGFQQQNYSAPYAPSLPQQQTPHVPEAPQDAPLIEF